MPFPTPAVLTLLAQAAASAPASAKHSSPAIAAPQLFVALGVVFVLGFLLQIVANWIVSKMLVPDDSAFSQAVKLFFMTLAGAMGAAVLAAVLVFAGKSLDIPSLNIVAIIVYVLLALYVVFATPMNVYKIGLLRSVAFVILAGIILTIGQFAAIIALGSMFKDTEVGSSFRALASRDPAVQSTALSWLRKNAPADAVPAIEAAVENNDARIAADRTKSLADRQAALQRMRPVLEARRMALNPKDQAAVAAYQHDAQEYSKWYHEVEAQAARPAPKQ